ncbi:unnamed protein product, partial [Rotaria socialis]
PHSITFIDHRKRSYLNDDTIPSEVVPNGNA